MNTTATISAIAALTLSAGAASAAPSFLDPASDAFSITANPGTADEATWRVPLAMLNPAGSRASTVVYDANTDGYTVNGTTSRLASITADFGSGTETRDGIELLNATGDVVLSLTDIYAEYESNPGVVLGFNAVGGAANTVIAVDSAIVNFAPIVAEGNAQAFVNVVNAAGSPDAVFSPTGTGAHRALADGANFASLLTSDTITSTVAAANDATPAFPTFIPVDGTNTTDNIQSQLRFTITQSDVAIVNTFYDLQEIPAPGAVALMGLAGLVAAKRRRNK